MGEVGIGGSNLGQSTGAERQRSDLERDCGWIVRSLMAIMVAPTGKATTAGGKASKNIFFL